jgi:hypothetical protein
MKFATETQRSQRCHLLRELLCALCVSVALCLFSGCGKPNAANIVVRKENQQLQSKIDELSRQHEADAAKIKSFEESKGTLPTLPNDRLEQLFTTHGLEFGKLTGVTGNKLRVFIVPTDEHGQAIKSAGSFTVELFDLAQTDNTLVGKWTFDVDQSRKSWQGNWPLYTYVLEANLDKSPAHDDLTVRVTFTDLLTQRTYTAQKQIKRIAATTS